MCRLEHRQRVQRAHVIRVALLQSLHQLLRTGSVRFDTERAGRLQETVELPRASAILTRASSCSPAGSGLPSRRNSTAASWRAVMSFGASSTQRRAAARPGLVVFQMQGDPGRTFRRIGIAGQDRGMLVVRLRQSQFAAMGADLTHQVAVDQILIQLALDRFGLGERQDHGRRLVGAVPVADRFLLLEGLTALGGKQTDTRPRPKIEFFTAARLTDQGARENVR